jgi:hypothetical protein
MAEAADDNDVHGLMQRVFDGGGSCVFQARNDGQGGAGNIDETASARTHFRNNQSAARMTFSGAKWVAT